MPLKQGSSDKVIQENISCILKKDGCGYDPPYLDPKRTEYTPAQAAAIAYAKAGRRNNTSSAKKNEKGAGEKEKEKVAKIKPKVAKKPGGEKSKVPPEINQAYPNNIIDDNYWNKLSNAEKDWYVNSAKKKLQKDQGVGNKPQTPVIPQEQTPTPTAVSPPEGWSTPQQASQRPQMKGDQLMIGGKSFKPGKTLPGSTSPTLYVDDQGNGEWVVKKGGAPKQNVAEHTANKVYETLSSTLPIGAIQSNLVDGNLVNKFIKDGKTLKQLTPEEIKKFNVAEKMRKSHLADALVANWDFAGLDNDNIMVDDKGNLLRIDTGGTFNFRAQGEAKNYTSIPLEIWSLREKNQGKQFWGNASEADYKDLWTNQLKGITSNRIKLDDVIDKSALDKNIANKFYDRLDSYVVAQRAIDNYVKTKGNPSSWKAVDEAMKRAFFETNSAVGEDNPGITHLTYLKKALDKQLSAVSSGMSAGITDKVFQDNLKDLQNTFPKVNWDQDYWDSLTPDLKDMFLNSAKTYKKRLMAKAQQSPQDSQEAQKSIDWSLYEDGSIESLAGQSFVKGTINNINSYLAKHDDPNFINEYADPAPFVDLSDDQKFVIWEYSKSFYKPLNVYLRNPDSSDSNSEFLKNVAEVFDEALAKLPNNTKKSEFWRMNRMDFNKKELVNKIQNLKPGDIYSTSTFDSYTDDHNGESVNRNQILDTFYNEYKFNFITIYRGNQVKSVAPCSSYTEERESILPRNTKLKVSAVKDESIGSYNGINFGGKEKISGKVKVIYLEDA